MLIDCYQPNLFGCYSYYLFIENKLCKLKCEWVSFTNKNCIEPSFIWNNKILRIGYEFIAVYDYCNKELYREHSFRNILKMFQ